MKQLLLTATTLVLFANIEAQIINWYDTPDGTFPAWGDWAYKDVLIPAGMKVDSVYGAFQRPGYPADAHDFIFAFNTGPVFDGPNSTSPWNYQTENNSLYGYWINLTSFSYVGERVVRIGLPTPAGAVWDSVGIATSNVSGASIGEVQPADVSVYPNPASESITICSNSFDHVLVTDLLGKTILTESKEQETKIIEVSELPSGTYFIRHGQSVVKFIKN